MLKEMLNETTSALTQRNKFNRFSQKRLMFLNKCAGKQFFKAK